MTLIAEPAGFVEPRPEVRRPVTLTAEPPTPAEPRPEVRRPVRRGPAYLVVALVAASLLTGYLIRDAVAPTAPGPAVVPVAAAVEPVGLDVPAIGVSTGPLAMLQPDGGGVLEAPADAATAGWSSLAPAPGVADGGERQPAVIAGHVSVGDTPGVFARLGGVAPGSEITVRLSDGTRAVYEAYHVESYAPTAFPTSGITGATDVPELRLISWGGVFDRGVGPFPDNIVVFARQLS